VRAFDEVDTGATFEFHDAEKQLAQQLIGQLSSETFDPDKYEDSFRERVLGAVEQKVAGNKLQLAPEAPRAQIIDLVEALKQSLEGSGGSKKDAQPLPPKKAASEKGKAKSKSKRGAKSSTG
jgi:DNA end-binding protein Ku